MDDEQGDAGPSKMDERQDLKQDEQSGATALVNKELFPDAQPGDRLIVEVDKVMGEEIEVRFVGKEGEGDEKENVPAPEPEESQGESLTD